MRDPGNGRWERTNRSKENKKLEESDFEISARNDGYGSYNNNTYTRSAHNPITTVYNVHPPDLTPSIY